MTSTARHLRFRLTYTAPAFLRWHLIRFYQWLTKEAR